MHIISSSVGFAARQVQHLCSPPLSCHTQLSSAHRKLLNTAVGKCKVVVVFFFFSFCIFLQVSGRIKKTLLLSALVAPLIHERESVGFKVLVFSRQEFFRMRDALFPTCSTVTYFAHKKLPSRFCFILFSLNKRNFRIANCLQLTGFKLISNRAPKCSFIYK